MATDIGTGKDGFRKLLVPAVLGLAGSAVAVVVRKKPKSLQGAIPTVRRAIPHLPEGGVGEITDDLRGRVDSVLGRDERGGDQDAGPSQVMRPKRFDTSDFERRRAERRERRESRRRRANS